ncbi:RING-type E3 ubiquitin transferase [Trifolium repens]|nr:RING-type E3 ubiquitin transferase [Trifolium repens]
MLQDIFYPSTSSQPFPSQETQTLHDHFDPSSSQINTDQPSYSQINIYQPSTYQHDIYQSSFEPPNIDINLDPTEEHHEDEVDDESEDEPFYNSEDEADDGEGDDEDETTPIGEAYVSPSYMASADLAYVDQYADIGHIPTLPVDGFAYCKPIVQVDGTWLYGKYKGTLLMATTQDENSNIFPFAFALVEDTSQ